MSRLNELIQQYCPDGVEYKSIESVTKSICSGLNPRKNFTLNGKGATCYYLTVKEMTTGKIVFSNKTDKITPDAVNTIQNRSRLETDDILLSGIGTIGKVAIVDIPVDNWNCSESVLLLKPNKEIIYPKYLKYILEGNETQAYFNSHATGSTLKGIRQKDLRTHSIPVPPLPVQEEIVRILDNFTELQAELQAELQKRLQQYNYYRDNLLSFEGRTDVEWKKLGDVCEFIKDGTHGSYNNVEDGYPLLSAKDINNGVISIPQDCRRISKEDYNSIYKKYKLLKGDVLITIVGSIGRTAIVGDGIEVAFQRSVGILRPLNIVLSSYLSYALQTSSSQKKLAARTSKSAQGGVYLGELSKIEIPIPPLTEQQRIVDILDRFDKLTNDITAGLPAEIEARQKQYEYYRDKLLTFKQKA